MWGENETQDTDGRCNMLDICVVRFELVVANLLLCAHQCNWQNKVHYIIIYSLLTNLHFKIIRLWKFHNKVLALFYKVYKIPWIFPVRLFFYILTYFTTDPLEGCILYNNQCNGTILEWTPNKICNKNLKCCYNILLKPWLHPFYFQKL